MLLASGGNVTIRGGSGRDRIRAGDGDDRIFGGGGADGIAAGAGDDEVNVRDGRRDRVRCGSGSDTVRADPFDLLERCESQASGRRIGTTAAAT